MPERGVDEPALALAGPDAPTVPGPGIFGVLMPCEMPEIPGFKLSGLAIVRAQDRDSREGAFPRLSSERCRKRHDQRGNRCDETHVILPSRIRGARIRRSHG